jgi:hypothetical protein
MRSLHSLILVAVLAEEGGEKRSDWELVSAETKLLNQEGIIVNELEHHEHKAEATGTIDKLRATVYPLRYYLSDEHDEMGWGGTSCEKIRSVLARPLPLLAKLGSTLKQMTFLGCTNPHPRNPPKRSYSVGRHEWEQPEYKHSPRPETLLTKKRGRVVLWRTERTDGCGSNSEAQLLTWALAHYRGWEYGGELPLWYLHEHGLNSTEYLFFDSSCQCMSRFTGTPRTLWDRIDRKRLNFRGGLKTPYPIVTNCAGVVDPTAFELWVNKASTRYYRAMYKLTLKKGQQVSLGDIKVHQVIPAIKMYVIAMCSMLCTL